MITVEEVFRNIRGKCFLNEPLSKHTTLRVGGSVRFFLEPADVSDLKNILKETKELGYSWAVIGNGSNILAGEKGLPDVVIKITNLNKVSREENIVRVEGGATLSKIISFSAECGLSGLEFLTGIPGTAGGSVKGNAGANGRCMADVLKEVEVIDADGGIKNIPVNKINFRYRHSDIDDDKIVISAVFVLTPDEKEKINERVKTLLDYRNGVFPKEPNAGCVFKNPTNISAGRVIDRLGLKGFAIGNAMISHSHANVIINSGGAIGAHVLDLMRYVQAEVYKKEEIKLEPEIVFWGNI